MTACVAWHNLNRAGGRRAALWAAARQRAVGRRVAAALWSVP